MAHKAWLILCALLPSPVKIFLLRLAGAKIGRGCYIGLTIIDAQKIELGDHVQIASFNLIHRLSHLVMHSGSRMNGFNWITGARNGSFYVGRNSAITRFHFFEASASILVDHDTIIAGRGSHFFTHGISSTDLEDLRSIRIGPWCYVGSSSRFVPGSGIARGTFVGMGSVVTRRIEDQYVLIAGSPAIARKQLSANDVYFSRAFLPHDHHPKGYDGALNELDVDASIPEKSPAKKAN